MVLPILRTWEIFNKLFKGLHQITVKRKTERTLTLEPHDFIL